MTNAIIFCGMLLAVTRVILATGLPGLAPVHDGLAFQCFKDAAHLFIGGLFTAWYIQRQQWQMPLFWGMNVVEVVTSILTRI